MNKIQKAIVLFFLLVLLLIVLYPPYYIESKWPSRSVISGTGWDWIFNLKSQPRSKGSAYWIDYQRIRFEILVCEILAVVILAGIFLLITKKVK